MDEVTATVREHITLEREVTNYWIAKYFEQELARDPDKTWTALLLGWVRQASPSSEPMPLSIAPPVMHAAAGLKLTSVLCELLSPPPNASQQRHGGQLSNGS